MRVLTAELAKRANPARMDRARGRLREPGRAPALPVAMESKVQMALVVRTEKPAES